MERRARPHLWMTEFTHVPLPRQASLLLCDGDGVFEQAVSDQSGLGGRVCSTDEELGLGFGLRGGVLYSVSLCLIIWVDRWVRIE